MQRGQPMFERGNKTRNSGGGNRAALYGLAVLALVSGVLRVSGGAAMAAPPSSGRSTYATSTIEIAAGAFLKTNGQDIVDQNGKAVMLRGFGPGEWFNIEAYMIKWPDKDIGGYGARKIRNKLIELMGEAGAEEFYRRWEQNIVTEEDVQQWARWGTNSVRLPFNYRSLSSADGVYREEGFQRLDRVIGWCKKNGIYVVLDMHAAPGAQNNELMSDSPDGVARFWSEGETYQTWGIHLWQKIAERYSLEPAVAGYNIFDEPILPAGHSVKKDLRPYYVRVSKAIREVDANHILFFDGTKWSSAFPGLETPWDANMVYDPHKYWDKNDQAAIRKYLKLRSKSNRPLWNAETGENTNQWLKDMVSLCERNNIGWNLWTYKKVGSARQPYTITAPPNYDAILKYVAGKGAKPSQAEATAIMFALADNAATEKCHFNPEVLDALFGGSHAPGP
jgi:endoglucanase